MAQCLAGLVRPRPPRGGSAVRCAAAVGGGRACRNPGALRARFRRRGGVGITRGRDRRLAGSHHGKAPHRTGERIGASPAGGARRSPERTARRPGVRAVGGASAPDGAGGAPLAGRLAGFGPRPARPLRDPLGAGDPPAARRDRRRRRLARPGGPRGCAGAGRRVGGDRGELRFVADAARIYRTRAAIPAERRQRAGTGRDREHSAGPGAWRDSRAAPGNRRGSARFRRARQAEFPGRSHADQRQ